MEDGLNENKCGCLGQVKFLSKLLLLTWVKLIE